MPLTPNILRFTNPQSTSPWANPLMALDMEPSRGPRSSSQAYFDTTKLGALAVYAETGSQTAVANATGIPQETIRNWVHEEATPSLLDELRSTIRYNCGWQLASMVKRRLDSLDEAFNRGDANVMRDGRIIYTPPKWKDQVIGLSILMDKWMLISGALSQTNALTNGLAKLGSQLDEIGTLLAASPSQAAAPSTEATPGENLLG